MKRGGNLVFVLTIFILGLVGGAFAYHSVEGWGLLDSFYFVVVTATTIGYGDFVPHTTAGKIFTMFFGFFGVAVALYLFSAVSSSIFRKHVGQKVREIKRDVRKEKEIKEDVKKAIKNIRAKR